MNAKKIRLIALFVFATITLQAMEIEVAGKVIDEKNKGVADAIVTCGNVTTKTDAKGAFSFKCDHKIVRGGITVKNKDASLSTRHVVHGRRLAQIIKLMPKISVEIVACGDDGKAFPSFVTYVMAKNDWGSQRGVTIDASGKKKLEGLENGKVYRLQWFNSSVDSAVIKPGQKSFVAKNGMVVKIVAHAFKAPAGTIGMAKKTQCKKLSSFCLDSKENLVLCDKTSKLLRVVSQKDELIATWKLTFSPQVIELRADGSFIVAGSNPGTVAILDKNGKTIASTPLPGNSRSATGVGSDGNRVFVCVQDRMGYAIYSMTDELAEAKRVIDNLRGCCGQLDFTVHKGIIYVAANTRFKVMTYDLNGKVIGNFGLPDGVKGFKGCCEPKNVCIDDKGFIYTAESDDCAVLKFDPKGKYVGRVGRVSDITGCLRVTIAVSKGAKKVYILDTTYNLIRLVNNPATKSTEKASSKRLDD